MTGRELLRELASRVAGERPLPVGGVARDRRLLRTALRGRSVGTVLVVGPGLAGRQALPGVSVDVAGTSPHDGEVTICSAVRTPGSLPPRRWDTVVVTEPGPLAERLAAIGPACRPGARLLVLDRLGWDVDGVEARALAEAATVLEVHGRRPRLWVAEVRA